jgi:hypothetical protein
MRKLVIDALYAHQKLLADALYALANGICIVAEHVWTNDDWWDAEFAKLNHPAYQSRRIWPPDD